MNSKKYDFEDLEELEDLDDLDDLSDLDSISELDELLEELDDDDDVDEELLKTENNDSTVYNDESNNEKENIEDEPIVSNHRKNDKKIMLAKILVPIILLGVISLLIIKGCSSNTTYTVKFDTDGGSKITSQKVKANDQIDMPTIPVKDGYTFLGWYLGDKKYDFNTKVTSDMTLEARWESTKTAKVTGVSLDQTSVTILPNGSVRLLATIEPSDAKDTNIIWTSSNDSIATVDSNGQVTAHALGTAVITAITTDGNHKATCSVTVSENVISVTGISFSKSTLELSTNDVVSINATITPANATNKGIIWSSSNNKVVKVVNGKVVAIGAGTAIITATTKDGNKTATINVTVKDVPVTGIKVSPAKVNMTIGDKPKQLTAIIIPTNASNKDVTWQSGNKNIVSVNSQGIITAIGAGTTTITATTKDGGKIAIVKVNVAKPIEATSVSISGQNSVVEGKTITLHATVKPNNTLNKAIKWTSSNPGIAIVNNKGIVTGIKAGEATITATTVNGKIATYQVLVTKPVVVKTYTYSVTKVQADEQAPVYYYVKVYENDTDVTNKVTNLAGIPQKGTSSTIKVADVNSGKLTKTINIVVNGESKTATLK